MGFFNRIKDPVRGAAHVVSAGTRPTGSSSAGCRMDLVVTIPGQPSFPAAVTLRVKDSHWPSAGMVLPIEAERGKPTKFRVLWDELSTGRERGAAVAAALADEFNRSSASLPVDGEKSSAGGSFVTISSVTINGQPASPEDIARYEAMTGMDLNGDGIIGVPGSPTAAPER